MAKLTFLGKTFPTRALTGVSFALVLLLFFTLDKLKLAINQTLSCAIAAALAFAVCFIVKQSSMVTSSYGHIDFAISFVVSFVFFYGILHTCSINTKRNRFSRPLLHKFSKSIFPLSVSIVILLSGIFVNPCVIGIGNFDNKDSLNTIKENNLSNDVWASVNSNVLLGNAPIVIGAKSINSCNIYPNIDLWSKIDPRKTNQWIYNRYAHIVINLDNIEQPVFELIQSDYFKVTINSSTLKQLGVTKIVSQQNDLEKYSNKDTKLKLLDTSGNIYIYSLV